MIRLSKARAVAAFEFLSEVRRPSYLIVTFGMPLFITAYGLVIGGLALFSQRSENQPGIYGVVDLSGLFEGAENTPPEAALPDEARRMLDSIAPGASIAAQAAALGGVSFRSFPDEASAIESFGKDEIGGFYVIRHDYLESGMVDSFQGEKLRLGTKTAASSLRAYLQASLMRGRVSGDLAARIREPRKGGAEWTLKADGTKTPRDLFGMIARLGVPIGFAVLLFISVIGTATSLVNGTAVEKENRVVDVLLSSAHADEILMGKLIGLGATGLLQVTVWFSMAGLSSLFFAARLQAAGVAIPWATLGLAIAFFLAGYLFLGSLMLGTGAFGNNAKEGQQWGLIWTLLATMPVALMGILIPNPHGALGKTLTWIPFSAPTTVLFRRSLDPAGIAWWEIAGAFAVLLISIRLALWLGARLFRVGLLLTGTRVNVLEMIRQARQRH